MNSIPIVYEDQWDGYKLLDSGDGEKLESIANYTMIRPDPRAIWSHSKKALWETVDARFIRTTSEYGEWHAIKPPPNPWILPYNDLTFLLRPTDFKHIGIFPEQAPNWKWLQTTIHSQPCSILNLFGYTGAATVVACKSGAHVTHVDSSKPSITWARENCTANTIPVSQTRWIVEDAFSFVSREQRRGNMYDGIILDPPRFGRGAKGEVWKLEDDLPKLLSTIRHIIKPKQSFILLNVYTADLSSLAIYNLMQSIFSDFHGHLEIAELATKEYGSDRLLPQGIVARWTN